MTNKPRLLDLFCGAGGCTRGYQLAGFEVTGIDLFAQPRYCGDAFFRQDALECLAQHGREFDAIHASPPCQAYTPLRALAPEKSYPDLVAVTRAALLVIGRPWVIENVPGAPLIEPITLCGAMFDGLRVYRHRLFESSERIVPPDHQRHTARVAWGRDRKRRYQEGGWFASITGDVGTYCGDAMGIDWMNGNELSQAIPPAYTHHVGHQLLAALS